MDQWAKEKCDRKGAGIFFTDGKRVLLLKRKNDRPNPKTWGLPGGRADEGETPIQVARREVTEEIGKIKGKQFDYTEDLDKNFCWVTFFYWVPNDFSCTISDEHSKWRWVSFEELSEYRLHPKFEDNLDKYLRVVKKYKRSRSFKEWLSVYAG